MTTPAWIATIVSVLTLVVATLVNLAIAAMNRKQARQIELHRVDPSVPLIPPPHPATTFFKTYIIFALSLVWNVCWLAHELNKTGPVTRDDIFAIAAFVASTFYLIGMQITYGLFKMEISGNRVTFNKIADVLERILKR